VVVEERRFKADGGNANKKLQQRRQFVSDSHLDIRVELTAPQMLVKEAYATLRALLLLGCVSVCGDGKGVKAVWEYGDAAKE
jgi:hypothetical protein